METTARTHSAKSPRTLYCAIYVRVSTTKDEQKDSPEHQVAICREMARRRSYDSGEIWLTPDELIYEDRSSGTDMSKRPQVQKMLKDAANGKFDVVIFKSISRFARDTEDSLHMLRRLNATNVRVVSYTENYDSATGNEFIFTIHAGLAQQGSEKISIDVLVGNLAKAGKGQWNGICPDGYDLGEDKRLLPNDRAANIQYIYDLFTEERLGSTNIVQRLNREGYRTKRGGTYARKAVYDILTNPVYCGDVIYGRRKQEIYYDEQNRRRKRSVIDQEERNLVVVENAHPAIVSREQFGKAQKILASNKKEKRDKSEWVYLLSGLIRCGCCGSPFNGKVNHVGTRYYRCTGKVARGAEGCISKGVRALDFERAIVDRLHEELSGINFESIEIGGEMVGQDEVIRQGMASVEKEIETLTTQSVGLLEKNLSGVISDDMFARMNQKIAAQIRDCETRRNNLVERLEALEQVESNTQELRESIAKLFATDIHVQDKRGAGRVILRDLMESIEIDEHGRVDVRLKFEKAN